MTTIYSGTVLDVPDNPFAGGTLRAGSTALAVTDGTITFRGSLADARTAHPDADVVHVPGILIPGMVDTHVHYPQLPIIGGLGMPLLDWLDQCALPQEQRLADPLHAEEIAGRFLGGLTRAGTTTALVFGSHFASAMDVFFAAANDSGLRITSGLVVSDRNLPGPLLTTPERARAEAQDLIDTWHNTGRLRYAVTPRFSLSASEGILEACADTLGGAADIYFTSHVNENVTEVQVVADLFPQASSYVDTYHLHGLLGPRSVLAHNVHPRTEELACLAATGAAVAHCPSSNSALGSGLFPLTAHLDAGVHVALGSDVGAGTGLNLLKDGLQAYFHQRLHPHGYPLTATHLLYLATRAGALALGHPQVGHLGVGMAFDAVHIHPDAGTTLADVLHYASDDTAALAAIFTLGTDADIDRVWVNGQTVSQRGVNSDTVLTL